MYKRGIKTGSMELFVKILKIYITYLHNAEI